MNSSIELSTVLDIGPSHVLNDRVRSSLVQKRKGTIVRVKSGVFVQFSIRDCRLKVMFS